MACTKLFLGNLPEVTNQIIQYLRNDLKSLYSCILVNRHLCQITIPILWEDPFVICRGHHYNFLDIYFSFLDDVDKVELEEKYGIKINSSSHNKPLFNYPSLIKTFNIFRFEMHVVNWINHLDSLPSTADSEPIRGNPSRKIFFPKTIEDIGFDIKKDLPNSIETINSICVLLFKLFINSEASLNNLRLLSSNGINFLPEMQKLILNNPKITSDLRVITLDVSNVSSESFLTSLPSISSSIRQMNVFFNGMSINISNVIRSQNRLSSLSFENLKYNVNLMNAFKSYPQTLTSIEFNICNFTNISSLVGILYLSQLKSLHFFHCRGFTVRDFQSLLVHPNPLKIKTLRVHGRTSGINLLLQKVGLNLQHLDLMLFEHDEREKAFDSIINYCFEIKLLYLSWIHEDDTQQLFKLITRVNIKYLSLEYSMYFENLTLLKQLGQLLPNSLRYLDLCLFIDPNDLKIFLNNCKHIKLSYLLVKNFNVNNVDLTFSRLKEFVKNQRVKNFAYQICSFDPNNDEHNNFEKLFDEIQPFVTMNKYSDLIIKISDL
ncbi:2649_t:CDS:1 [Funneliformis mosseae]|uniref:2649_t:CDS:1 n=1 Tax=Funneliformis mosseae TaxID=27381 RepID=A0A9N9GJZ6_FUNMO|nr:2649_t:CDS:1 [Funneliformis mosseae]